MILDKTFDSVEAALADLRLGKPLIVTDDESRENEGDLIFPAQLATPKLLNFLMRQACGIICAPASADWLDRLELPSMVERNQECQRTDFCLSVDAARGITTGVSAADRAYTLQLLASEQTLAKDLVRPGHIFPIRAKTGGVFERPGHTEAAVDLAQLAGFQPVGVLCEIITDDGTMARIDDLRQFKQRFDLKMISIASLVTYREHQRLALV